MTRVKRKTAKRRLPECAPELLAWWQDEANETQTRESIAATFFEPDEVQTQWAEVRDVILRLWLANPARFAEQIYQMRICSILSDEDREKLGLGGDQ